MMDQDAIRVAAAAREYEGLRLVAYLCPAGIPTIGYGHTDGVSHADVGSRRCTKGQAEAWLLTDVSGALADLDRRFPWWRHLPDGPRFALADMAFNMGIVRLSGFRKMLAALERGDFRAAATEAENSKWFRQVGQRARDNAAKIAKGA